MEKLFKLKEHGTDVKTEIIAGITTFLAMAYILAVNPSYLGGIDGMSAGAVFSATAISAGIATLCMAFFANYPVALASGMGLNAFFAFTVCGAMGYSYKVALTAVFIEGIIFMLLSLFKFREALVNKIPSNLKFAITAGIGLFIAIIALLNANVVIASESTTVGEESSPSATVVDSLATTTFELSNAMIAINRPIPAVIANLRFEGILFTRASLNLNSESNNCCTW